MKKQVRTPIKFGILLSAFMLINTLAFSLNYTAVVSGNWSSTATWGGTIPAVMNTDDQVTIPVGINVVMDNNITLNGATAEIIVLGSLSNAGSNTLDIIAGNISGTGSITADMIMMGAGASMVFTGTLTANTFSNSALSLPTAAAITVNQTLILTGGVLTIETGGSITTAANATIMVMGGQLTSNGGSINLSPAYNLVYGMGTTLTGPELAGPGLQNVTINAGAGNFVFLSNDLTLNGTLTIMSGTLVLASHNLNIIGDVDASGTGMISSTINSSISINSINNVSGLLVFTSTSAVSNFTVSLGSTHQASISGTLDVTGILSIVTGTLNLNNINFTVAGSIDNTGTGTVSSDVFSNISLTSSTSIAGTLMFSNASLVNNLIINPGAGNEATIGGTLQVNGTLMMTSGMLQLEDATLTITGNIGAAGTGTISSDANSNVAINTSVSTTGNLSFTPGSNTVHNFIVNISGNGTVMLTSDLNVEGSLSLIAGHVNIGGNRITLGSSASITGGGASAYVITETNGSLAIPVTAGLLVSTTFPVGTAAAYFPAAISLDAISASGTVRVGVTPDVYANGTTGVDISTSQPIVDATWDVNSDITSNLNLNLDLMWSTTAEVNGFMNTSAYVSHYTAAHWDMNAPAMSANIGGGMYSLSRVNLTSLSPFGVFGQAASVGVTELSSTEVQLYPNPAVESVVITNMDITKGNVTADVYNAYGQLVGSYQLSDKDNSIPVKELPTGNYFIKLYNNSMNSVKGFTKM